MKNADAVIIGGGIIGTSIAYHLSKKNIKKIILLEKEATLGEGSTGKCAGGVRAQFSTEINVQLSVESIKAFENFSKELEYDVQFFQNGYLFLLTTDKLVDSFKRTVEMQQKYKVKSSFISPLEAKKIMPELNIENVKGATYCPTDGFLSPHEIVQGYAEQARKAGTEILLSTPATGIEIVNNEVKAVMTATDKISTPIVINAAGPHAKEIGKMANIDVPVEPKRSHIFVTSPFPYIKDPFPLTIDFATNFYFHRESAGILMGRMKDSEPFGFNTTVDWDYLPEVIEPALHIVPAFEKAEIATGWAGLYEMSPDHHPILGFVPEIKGFVCANGFSGHGFMHGPAVGKLIAELIADSKTSIDISSLSITRFKEGKLIKEDNVF